MKTFAYNTDFYDRPEFQVFVEAPADSRFMLIVKAQNGDRVIKPYADRDAAKRALSYYLKKYDKQNLGASGSWYKLSLAA